MPISRSLILRRLAPCLFLVSLVIGVLATLAPAGSSAATTCTKYASPTGSDSTGTGSLSSPYATPSKLDASLAAGQTGCLESGAYGSLSTQYDFDTNGTASSPITLTPAPGDSVTLNGFVVMNGAYMTLNGFTIDGSNTFYDFADSFNPCNQTGDGSQALQINGDGDVFENNDYSQSVVATRQVGIGVGFNGTAPQNAIIRFNKIHDVGSCMAYDHLIYLDSGNGTQIYDNWLYNDPNGFGVQVYPGPTNSDIYDNVVYNAGAGFTVGGTSTTSNNQIHNNIVADSTGLPDAGTAGSCISDWWESTAGTGNTFTGNDCYSNPAGVGTTSAVSLSANVTSNPEFADAATDDFQITAGSVVAGWGSWDGTSADTSTTYGGTGTTTTPPPTTTTPPPTTTTPPPTTTTPPPTTTTPPPTTTTPPPTTTTPPPTTTTQPPTTPPTRHRRHGLTSTAQVAKSSVKSSVKSDLARAHHGRSRRHAARKARRA